MEEFEKNVKLFFCFCEKIIKYSLQDMKDNVINNSPLLKELNSFKTKYYKLTDENKISIFYNFFKNIAGLFSKDESKLNNFISMKDESIMLSISDISKIRIGFIYIKTCKIYDKINEYLKEKEYDEERQEINYSTAFLFKLFKVFESMINNTIKDEESIGLINDVIEEAEEFLKGDEISTIENVDINPMMDFDPSKMMEQMMGKMMGNTADGNALKGLNIDVEDIKKMIGVITESGVLEKAASCVVNGDIGGMMNIANDKELLRKTEEVLGR